MRKEILRREVVDANVFALLAAGDMARLMMAHAVGAGSRSSGTQSLAQGTPQGEGELVRRSPQSNLRQFRSATA